MIDGMPLLNSETGVPRRAFQSQSAKVVFAPDGRTVFGWPDGDLICLWETITGKERGRIPGKFAAVALSPDGALLAAVDRAEDIIRIWDLAMLKEIQRLDGHDSDITSLAFSRQRLCSFPPYASFSKTVIMELLLKPKILRLDTTLRPTT